MNACTPVNSLNLKYFNMSNIPLPTEAQIISDAAQVSDLGLDFFLIGWQGQRGGQAPLICVSSSQLTQFIEDKIAQAVKSQSANPNVLSTKIPKDSVELVSIEELVSEATKSTVRIQYKYDGKSLVILSSTDSSIASPKAAGSNIYNLAINSFSAKLDSLNVTVLGTSGAAGSASLFIKDEVFYLKVGPSPCIINVSYSVNDKI